MTAGGQVVDNSQEGKKDRKATPGGLQHTSATHMIAKVMQAEPTKFPVRKIGAYTLLIAGVTLVMFHSITGTDSGPSWEAWVLIGLGAGDIGIRGSGALLDRFLGHHGKN